MYLVTSQRSGEQHHGNAAARLFHTEQSCRFSPLDLYTFNLSTFSSDAASNCRITHWKRRARKWQWATLKQHPCICVEGLRKSKSPKSVKKGPPEEIPKRNCQTRGRNTWWCLLHLTTLLQLHTLLYSIATGLINSVRIEINRNYS
jgi:hypothetical protein